MQKDRFSVQINAHQKVKFFPNKDQQIKDKVIEEFCHCTYFFCPD
jgi:hypothetical protein